MSTGITVQWLLDRWRLDIEDPVQEQEDDQLWSLAEGLQYIDEAQKEFCSNVECIYDATSYAFLPIEAGQSLLYIDPQITTIRRAILNTANCVLELRTLQEISRSFTTRDYGRDVTTVWETAEGTPRFLIPDYDVKHCRIVPIPTVADTISLAVYRLPKTIEQACSVLEIPDRFRVGLLHKMKALAYSKQNADSYDPKAAGEFDANWRRWIYECTAQNKVRSRPHVIVAYGGL